MTRTVDMLLAAMAAPWLVLHVVSGAALDVLLGREDEPPYPVSPTTGRPTA